MKKLNAKTRFATGVAAVSALISLAAIVYIVQNEGFSVGWLMTGILMAYGARVFYSMTIYGLLPEEIRSTGTKDD